MEQVDHLPIPGLRQLNLKKSFKMAVRSLLTTCAKEEFMNAFSTVDKAKQESLYLLFIKVITSLHENIEEEFESICRERQVTSTLDIVEQLLEEQALDILSSDMTSLVDVKQNVLNAKKDEIAYLTDMLEKVVKQNNHTKAQVDSLKNASLETLGSGFDVGKTRSWTSDYGQQTQQ